jgi:hypothetical protein
MWGGLALWGEAALSHEPGMALLGVSIVGDVDFCAYVFCICCVVALSRSCWIPCWYLVAISSRVSSFLVSHSFLLVEGGRLLGCFYIVV